MLAKVGFPVQVFFQFLASPHPDLPVRAYQCSSVIQAGSYVTYLCMG